MYMMGKIPLVDVIICDDSKHHWWRCGSVCASHQVQSGTLGSVIWGIDDKEWGGRVKGLQTGIEVFPLLGKKDGR